MLSWLRLLYDNSFWPKTDRLDEVRKRGLSMHAKWWWGPEGCEGKVIKRFFRDGDFLAHISIVEVNFLVPGSEMTGFIEPLDEPY